MSRKDNGEAERGSTKLTERGWFRWLTVAATLVTFIAFFFSIPPVQDKFFGKRVEVTLELISEIPVFDVREPLEGLRIEFNNQDLTALRKNLFVVRLQLRNSGDVSITPSKMTPSDPIGFRILRGEIVQITNTEFNSEHLRKFAKPTLVDNSLFISQDIIFDPNDAVKFDLIVLRDSNEILEYSPTGKIEGLRRIQFIDTRSLEISENFSNRTFKGNLWVQFARLGVYSVAAIVLVTIGYGTINFLVGIPERRRRKNRRRISKSISALLSEDPPRIQLIIKTIYEAYGWSYLAKLLAFINLLSEGKAWDRFLGTKFERHTARLPKWESEYEYVSRAIDHDYLSVEDVFRVFEALGFASVKEKRIDSVLVGAVERTVLALEQHAKLDNRIQDFDSRRALPYGEDGEVFRRPDAPERVAAG